MLRPNTLYGIWSKFLKAECPTVPWKCGEKMSLLDVFDAAAQ
jgi:hypothetical protein